MSRINIHYKKKYESKKEHRTTTIIYNFFNRRDSKKKNIQTAITNIFSYKFRIGFKTAQTTISDAIFIGAKRTSSTSRNGRPMDNRSISHKSFWKTCTECRSFELKFERPTLCDDYHFLLWLPFIGTRCLRARAFIPQRVNKPNSRMSTEGQ